MFSSVVPDVVAALVLAALLIGFLVAELFDDILAERREFAFEIILEDRQRHRDPVNADGGAGRNGGDRVLT